MSLFIRKKEVDRSLVCDSRVDWDLAPLRVYIFWEEDEVQKSTTFCIGSIEAEKQK